MENKNSLVKMLAVPQAESQNRSDEFCKLLTQPAAYTATELIDMVFAESKPELTPFERELIRKTAKTLDNAQHEVVSEMAVAAILEATKLRSIFANFLHVASHRETSIRRWAEANANLARIEDELNNLLKQELSERVKSAKLRAKKAADARHDKDGGSRDIAKSIRGAWASGKYGSRDKCAEEQHSVFGVSFSTARKALRNTPKPT